MMARKLWEIGEVSTRRQPTNAPKWTVKQHTGQLAIIVLAKRNYFSISLGGEGVLTETQPFAIQD